MDASTDLLSVYDQFDDDPLADPDYEGFEDTELEGEEILEEDGVHIDSEEILEQEEISQLEDIATGEIKILTQSALEEETNSTTVVEVPMPRDQQIVDPPSNTAEATNDEVEDTITTAAAEVEEEKTKTMPTSERSEATLDSLVNALMSAAELDTPAQPNKDKEE